MVAALLFISVVVLLLVDLVLERRRSTASGSARPAAPALAEGPALPAGLFVYSGHSWAEILRSGQVRVGIDGLVGYLVGAVDRVIPRAIGVLVRQGEPLVSIEQGGRQLVLAAPVTGKVTFHNDPLLARPATLKRGTYGENWVCVLQPTHLAEEIGSLRVARVASEWFRQEFRRLADCLADLAPAKAGMAMQDGGMPVAGALRELPDEAWARFQGEFLGAPPA